MAAQIIGMLREAGDFLIAMRHVAANGSDIVHPRSGKVPGDSTSGFVV